MPQFNQTVRVLGSKLDVDETYVDATVTGVSLDGQVKLVEDVDTNPREWTISLDELGTWFEEDTLAPVGLLAAPNANIWSMIEQMDDEITKNHVAAAEGDLRDKIVEIFTLVAQAQKRANPTDTERPQ